MEPLWQDYLSISPYVYALNNSVNAKDIDGRDAKSVGALSKAINPFVALGFSNNGVKTEQGAMIVRNENHPFFKSIYLTNYAVGSENSIHTSENVGKNEQVLGRIHDHRSNNPPSFADFIRATGLPDGGVSFIETQSRRYAIEMVDSKLVNSIKSSHSFRSLQNLFYQNTKGFSSTNDYENYNSNIGGFIELFKGGLKLYDATDMDKTDFKGVK